MSTAPPPEGYRPGDRPMVGDGPPLPLTRFPAPARWATRGQHRAWSWTELLDQLSQPELWPGGGSIPYAAARLPAWSFARFRDDTRVVMRDEALAAAETRLRVVEVHGLMVEYEDEPAIDAAHLVHWWGRWGFLGHTTGYNEQPMGEKPEGPRWRVLLPFSRPVDLEGASKVAAWARHSRHNVGIVAARTEEVWRVSELPAVAPGGYRWVGSGGPALDPFQAIAELEAWQIQDRELRAAEALIGTTITESLHRFGERHASQARRPLFPLPGGAAAPPPPPEVRLDRPAPPVAWASLSSLVSGLWPGRVLALVGASGSGRSSFALQLAAETAGQGWPVLYVLTRMGTDEVVARLIAAGTEGVSPSDLLRGGGGAAEVGTACRELGERFPALHLWAPAAPERTLEELFRKVRAASEAHGARPPLVVVDAVEGWAVDDPSRGIRVLASGMRDLSHAGALGPEWPGAGVVLVSQAPGGADLGSARRLIAAWDEGRLDTRGPLEADASLVVVLATDPPAAEPEAVRAAAAVVAKNRDGRCGAVSMRFHPVEGRFDEGA